jgi:hypothetical protein
MRHLFMIPIFAMMWVIADIEKPGEGFWACYWRMDKEDREKL